MLSNQLSTEDEKNNVYYFDIFKGQRDAAGKIVKLRSVGVASHLEGLPTYKVSLKLLLHDEFYLLPERQIPGVQYGILTRSASPNPGKKFLWHTVGTGTVLTGADSGYMLLDWDLFNSRDIYMNLQPKTVRFFIPSLIDSETE